MARKKNEIETIRFGDIRKVAGREKVLEALQADYLGGQVAGCEIRIEAIDWEQYNNRVYAIVKAFIESCPEDSEVKHGEYVRIAFRGRVITDQLKLAEKYVEKGKYVIATVELRESKNGRKYLVLR